MVVVFSHNVPFSIHTWTAFGRLLPSSDASKRCDEAVLFCAAGLLLYIYSLIEEPKLLLHIQILTFHIPYVLFPLCISPRMLCSIPRLCPLSMLTSFGSSTEPDTIRSSYHPQKLKSLSIISVDFILPMHLAPPDLPCRS